MSLILSEQETLAAIRGINIPPQPEILRKAHSLTQQDDPDIVAIAHLISKDTALSASVLKTINSSAFALRTQVNSVQHGIAMLGLNNIINIVASVALREALGKNCRVATPRYWAAATRTAMLCAYISRHLGIGVADEAYTVGLFHDCGIPLLAQKYPDYLQILKEANGCATEKCTDFEDRHTSTNHAVVGFFMTKSWNLPPVIREVVLAHHDVDEAMTDDTRHDRRYRQLLVVLKLADSVEHAARGVERDYDWERSKPYVLDYLGMSEIDAEDLRDLMLEKLPASEC